MKLLFGLLASAAATTSNWVNNSTKQDKAIKQVGAALPKYTVDLDLPQDQRWTAIATLYQDKVPAILAYLESMIPKWALPIVAAIGRDIEPYFKDYGDEMKGIAAAMKLDLGDVVAMNLVYQLEHIGLNCSNWNNTGPTVPNDPGCMDVDPEQEWCYCHNNSHLLDKDSILWKEQDENRPGLCTSVVAQDTDGHIWHGRNLDWNLPVVLRQMAADVTFTQGGKPVMVGTTLVGFVGLLNGLKLNSDGSGAYSVSMDARGKGGKIVENLLESLSHKHAMTPAQHLRKTLETTANFTDAVDVLSDGPLIDEIYYIMAGILAGEGVVITRDRNDGIHGPEPPKQADKWFINTTDPTGWFRLETNYDHWNPVPVADDRRTPGNAAMNAMGQKGISVAGITKVMHTWPVFNDHTDYTGLYIPYNATYQSNIWLNNRKKL